MNTLHRRLSIAAAVLLLASPAAAFGESPHATPTPPVEHSPSVPTPKDKSLRASSLKDARMIAGVVVAETGPATPSEPKNPYDSPVGRFVMAIGHDPLVSAKFSLAIPVIAKLCDADWSKDVYGDVYDRFEQKEMVLRYTQYLSKNIEADDFLVGWINAHEEEPVSMCNVAFYLWGEDGAHIKGLLIPHRI